MEKHNPVGEVVTTSVSRTDPVQMSKNEVSALCFKAARGAGMSWGLAEEAGFAAAWLHAQGFDGPGNLASHLNFATGMAWRDICPQVRPGQWSASSSVPLCPVAVGATLADHAGLPETRLAEAGLMTGPVSHPLLVLPFLAAVAQAIGKDLSVTCLGQKTGVTADGRVLGEVVALSAGEACELNIRIETLEVDRPAPREALPVDLDTIEQLNIFALRTTVPPSERSRAGAGSLASDND
ncbi:MAG: DUF3726 domain-containing protein [Roseibium sp.]|uniref:DUF3726 domain-containing protein n=1 Tax=Roseibium sp. TaxID=1936156 RepID=UPI002606D126|nr:DUF3726 domain-containing protein [Roseibium sp.]MCV0424809.1 DUF3726 domain-containing protein [Roseibium sp.]